MTVLNKHRDRIPADAIDIMRPSKFGNPFRIGTNGDRASVIHLYEVWLKNQIHRGAVTAEELAAMDGKDLVCCCRPRACHGDVLERAIRWAVNRDKPRRGPASGQ